jgi:hypothetical protein
MLCVYSVPGWCDSDSTGAMLLQFACTMVVAAAADDGAKLRMLISSNDESWLA